MRAVLILAAMLFATLSAAETCKVGDPYCPVAVGAGWNDMHSAKCSEGPIQEPNASASEAKAFFFAQGARTGISCFQRPAPKSS